jgi:hypothetical protein
MPKCLNLIINEALPFGVAFATILMLLTNAGCGYEEKRLIRPIQRPRIEYAPGDTLKNSDPRDTVPRPAPADSVPQQEDPRKIWRDRPVFPEHRGEICSVSGSYSWI